MARKCCGGLVFRQSSAASKLILIEKRSSLSDKAIKTAHRRLIGKINVGISKQILALLLANQGNTNICELIKVYDVILFRKHFPKDDGRAAFSLTSCDPRIHFCLNCGAESCPRINVLQVKRDPDLLERSLKKAAQSYCDDDANVQIDPDKNEIRLSKIFDWYAVDFGVRKQSDLPVQVNMIADWLTDKRRAALMRQLIVAKKTKVIFLPYNWQLNALKKASTQ